MVKQYCQRSKISTCFSMLSHPIMRALANPPIACLLYISIRVIGFPFNFIQTTQNTCFLRNVTCTCLFTLPFCDQSWVSVQWFLMLLDAQEPHTRLSQQQNSVHVFARILACVTKHACVLNQSCAKMVRREYDQMEPRVTFLRRTITGGWNSPLQKKSRLGRK